MAKISRKPVAKDSIFAMKVERSRKLLKEMDSFLETMPEGATKEELIGKVKKFYLKLTSL